MYLMPEGVDTTLAFVDKNAALGSAIVFDYVYQTVLEGIQKQSEIRSMRRYRFMAGEELTFGIPEGTVGRFLQSRGFQQVKDAPWMNLKPLTLPEKMPTGGRWVVMA